MLQIHIAGSKRAGKTTLGTHLAEALNQMQMNPVLVDVDALRASVFGPLTQVPDSDASLDVHLETIRFIFRWVIPSVITSGGTPIVVAGHSRAPQYDGALEISRRFNTSLKFLLLETPPLSEASLRGASTEKDRSDMRNFSDRRIKESFLQSAFRINALYKEERGPHLLRLAQAAPKVVFRRALDFILA